MIACYNGYGDNMHVVYGGAFNPPTKAHQKIPEILKRKLSIDRFTYLPVSTVYGKNDLLCNHHRLKMLQLMGKELKDVEISDLEMQDDRFKGTYDALKRLQNKGEKTAFVIGSDHIKTLHRWKKADQLLSEFYCIILNRNQVDMPEIIANDPFLKKHRDHLLVVADVDLPYASSDYRKNKDKSLLPGVVADYIERHNLYEG